LVVIDAIDRAGSFAAAAAELYRVPSAVTYAVRKLEQDLGVELFDRSRHRAVLTSAGRELLRSGRELLHAARAVESRVKRVATGWEAELSIAVDGLIEATLLYPTLRDFYAEGHGTRLRLLTEVYGGCWDALVTGRALLAVGAPGDGPAGGGYSTKPLGVMRFAFVVSPDHPLARAREPLRASLVSRYRVVSAADSSRHLPAGTSGLLSGQDVLTVPDLPTKIAAHCAGLGVGHLPRSIAESEAAAGRLKIKRVEEPKQDVPLWIAWRTDHGGSALRWFLDRLDDPDVRACLLPKRAEPTS
ncbi:MAG: LysR family transcriptional regulator, partial [Candidatus Binatia bacterium]